MSEDKVDYQAGAGVPACDLCGSREGADTSWRWDGRRWEHACPERHPQAGHMPLGNQPAAVPVAVEGIRQFWAKPQPAGAIVAHSLARGAVLELLAAIDAVEAEAAVLRDAAESMVQWCSKRDQWWDEAVILHDTLESTTAGRELLAERERLRSYKPLIDAVDAAYRSDDPSHAVSHWYRALDIYGELAYFPGAAGTKKEGTGQAPS